MKRWCGASCSSRWAWPAARWADGTATRSATSPSRTRGATGRTWSPAPTRSEEHTSELQSLMRISYAVFCLKKKKQKHKRVRQQSLNRKHIRNSTTDSDEQVRRHTYVKQT